MQNIITLRNVYGKEKAPCILNPVRNANGLFPSFVKKVRSIDNSWETEMILSESELNSPERDYFIPEDMSIEISDGKTFNLDNPLDANIWNAIKDSVLIAPSRDTKDSKGNLLIDGGPKRYGQAEFYIEVPGADSEKRITRIKLVSKAYQFIENDSSSGRLTKTKLLGKTMINAPESDIQDYLYQKAEKDPQAIINLYTSEDVSLKLLLIDAKANNIIQKNNGTWIYGEISLGMTDDAVIAYWKNPVNSAVLIAIRNATYPQYVQKKETSKKSAAKSEE